MRYKAYVFAEERGVTGIPTQTRSSEFIRCRIEARRTTELDDEDAGVHSLTYFRLTFWKRSADRAGIKAGSEIEIDGVIYKVIGTKPAGVGFRQYLIADAEVHTDD